MQRKNRKEIDRFLKILDDFVFTNYESDKGIQYDFINIFKLNHNKQGSLSKGQKILSFNIIDRLCNEYTQSSAKNDKKYVIKGHRRQYLTDIDRLLNLRGPAYVQRVAYGMKWKKIKDLSYEHIFMKICHKSERSIIPFGERFKNQLIRYQDGLNEFIVPEDFETDDDLLIY